MSEITPPPATLKSTILLLRSYAQELLRKWYWYAIVGTIFLTYSYYKAHRQPTTYQSGVSIMINNDGGAVSGLMQLAGQFGLGGSSELKTEKLVELMVSQRMVLGTLTQLVTINGKKDVLLNHYLDEVGVEHISDTLLRGFRFVQKQPQDFTLRESTIAQKIYTDITTEMLSASVGKSGIVRATCTSVSEQFAKEFLALLASTLCDYYADKTVEQQSRAYHVISYRCDSLERVLYSTEYALANWIDYNRTALRAGSLPAKQGVKREQYKREAEVLNVMYVEAIKNRELAHINLLLSTPSVQVIDYPRYPLAPQVPNRLNMYISALISAAAAVTIAIVFNKMVREAFAT